MTPSATQTCKHRQPIRFREGERRPVSLRGFALGDKVDADVVVADLTYNGCKVVSDQPLSRGARVELRILGKGQAKAEVRWSRGPAAGLSFIE
jgi:hypothetical protein